MRTVALLSVVENCVAVQALWEESFGFVKDAEFQSRVIGVPSSMKSFNFFLGTILGELFSDSNRQFLAL